MKKLMAIGQQDAWNFREHRPYPESQRDSVGRDRPDSAMETAGLLKLPNLVVVNLLCMNASTGSARLLSMMD